MISTKKTWISTSAWRGYEQPITAVGGANDTGNYSDSPCPSHVRESEIKSFCKKLKAAGIKYKTTWGKSSNVFCHHQYVCVAPEDHDAAYEIAKSHVNETQLFYPCERIEKKTKIG